MYLFSTRSFPSYGIDSSPPTTSSLILKPAKIHDVFSKRIPLPNLEEYPIGLFSNIRSDFESATAEYPKLAKQLQLLCKLQEQHHDSYVITCLCVVKKGKKSFLELVFRVQKKNTPKVLRFLEELGI